MNVTAETIVSAETVVGDSIANFREALGRYRANNNKRAATTSPKSTPCTLWLYGLKQLFFLLYWSSLLPLVPDKSKERKMGVRGV